MLIDAHTHLDQYEETLEAALAEIEQQRIFTISNSMDIPSYQRNLEIAARCDWVLPTFGIHPQNAVAYADRLRQLNPLIERSPILGEIGLDFHWVEDASCYPAQRKVFTYFLAAAREQGKIVNVHTKGAEAEILEWLDFYCIERAIIHWYSGPLDIFREMINRGYTFTVGVEVSHTNHIQALVRELPLSQLLTETDNPGGLAWLTGARGMPRHMDAVIQTVAELKQTTPEAIQQAVYDNFIWLVEDDPWLPERYIKLLPELSPAQKKRRKRIEMNIDQITAIIRILESLDQTGSEEEKMSNEI
jgi:TatD DNase family protein